MRKRFCFSGALSLFLIALWVSACTTPSEARKIEAKDNLKMLGEGAVMYFQEEHPVGEDKNEVFSYVYPRVPERVCATKGWSDEPWKTLRFSPKGESIEYCYESSKDGKSFKASAEVNGEKFCIEGDIAESIGGPKISAPSSCSP